MPPGRNISINLTPNKGTTTVKDFCMKNELSKSQFYYHKKRLEKENPTTVFHAVS